MRCIREPTEDRIKWITNNGWYGIFRIQSLHPTGRPSNRFGGLNFGLNKKDGSRKKFISRYGKEGMLVEMDYDAYHLRLIGEVVDYQFPKGSVHNHMVNYMVWIMMKQRTIVSVFIRTYT